MARHGGGLAISESAPPVTATDPLIAPFLAAHLDYREVLRQRVSILDDEELIHLAELFHHQNLRNIPSEFWPVAPRVRVFIRDEQERRARASAAINTGEPTA